MPREQGTDGIAERSFVCLVTLVVWTADYDEDEFFLPGILSNDPRRDSSLPIDYSQTVLLVEVNSLFDSLT